MINTNEAVINTVFSEFGSNEAQEVAGTGQEVWSSILYSYPKSRLRGHTIDGEFFAFNPTYYANLTKAQLMRNRNKSEKLRKVFK